MSVKDKPVSSRTAAAGAASAAAAAPPKCCHRRQTLEALQRSAIHQSLATPTSRVAMARCRTSTLDDPQQAMEVLRSLLQPAINAEVRRAMQRFVDDFFRPAAANAAADARRNSVAASSDGVAAAGAASDKLVEEICSRALDQAKSMFRSRSDKHSYSRRGGVVAKSGELKERKQVAAIKRKLPMKKGTDKKRKMCEHAEMNGATSRSNTDLILLSKNGKPVRREAPKWEPSRFTPDTLFILGSRANKALGFGQTRGRLYIKHPELFKLVTLLSLWRIVHRIGSW